MLNWLGIAQTDESHLCRTAVSVQACVFVPATQFTAFLPGARRFNSTIMRSARQIGFNAPGGMLDFYYNRHHLETIIVNV